MRELTGGDVERELVVGDLEILRELSVVLGHHRGLTVGQERNADIAAADDLGRKVPDHGPQLRGEQRTTDRAHHATRAGDHLLHLGRGLLLQRRSEGIRDARGYRLSQLLPHRQGGFHPSAASHGHSRTREIGDRRRFAEPEGCQGEGIVGCRPVGSCDARAVLVRDVQRLRGRGIPRDPALAGRGHRALQLLHGPLDHRGVEPHLLQFGELVAAHAGLTEQLPEQLGKVVVGVPVVVSHGCRLSAGS